MGAQFQPRFTAADHHESAMTRNHLAQETSPYLLQHKDNPVHWLAWGEEAFAIARRDNKPILLSIGYAACHWCHVMAHESFEDTDVAAVMNAHFVNVKVDREERPDVDRIYMAAIQALGEQGGWPLTMFLKPDGKPFWGGTYFPKTPRYGRPGFIQVLERIAAIYQSEPDKVAGNASAIVAALNAPPPTGEAGAALQTAMIDQIAERVLGIVDSVHGGIGQAPKFPQCAVFELLWRAGLRTRRDDYFRAVSHTLACMCQGGIYDHLGGGFARYSVDRRWLVPHFEKMLYDNAQIIQLMTLVWQRTREPLLERRIAETCEWVLREMIADGGGFASSLDADSEGEEGRFYVWSQAGIERVLGAEEAAFFAGKYDVTPQGNWEGKVILNRLRDPDPGNMEEEARLAAAREQLFQARARRVHPGWDDKVLSDWNGLMICALARAAHVFSNPRWMSAAETAFAFIRDTMWVDGRLHHAARAGRLSDAAIGDDYANMIAAALSLHQYSGRPGFLDTARSWAAEFDARHWDETRGLYLFAGKNTPHLVVQLASGADDATPNGNATMLRNLALLYGFSGEQAYRDRADRLVASLSRDALANPFAHASFLNAFEQFDGPLDAVIIAGRDRAGAAGARALADALTKHSLPDLALQILAPDEKLPPRHPARGKPQIDGLATLYLCRGGRCSLPVNDPDLITPDFVAGISS